MFNQAKDIQKIDCMNASLFTASTLPVNGSATKGQFSSSMRNTGQFSSSFGRPQLANTKMAASFVPQTTRSSNLSGGAQRVTGGASKFMVDHSTNMMRRNKPISMSLKMDSKDLGSNQSVQNSGSINQLNSGFIQSSGQMPTSYFKNNEVTMKGGKVIMNEGAISERQATQQLIKQPYTTIADQLQGYNSIHQQSRIFKNHPEQPMNQKQIDYKISGKSTQPPKIMNNHFDINMGEGLNKATSMLQRGLLAAALAVGLFVSPPAAIAGTEYPVVGKAELMSKKDHGTCAVPVQENLRFGADVKTADRISCYNRDWAESAGFAFQKDKSWTTEVMASSVDRPITYYDSVSGKALFRGPIGRDAKEFLQESYVHGWPSFRDQEVVWDNVRTLKNGEVVSMDGTHLGHNLPDRTGNRYCINLVSISGNKILAKKAAEAAPGATLTAVAAPQEKNEATTVNNDKPPSPVTTNLIAEMIEGVHF